MKKQVGNLAAKPQLTQVDHDNHAIINYLDDNDKEFFKINHVSVPIGSHSTRRRKKVRTCLCSVAGGSIWDVLSRFFLHLCLGSGGKLEKTLQRGEEV